MSSSAERTAGPVRRGPVRSPQSLLGGLMLLALGGLALFLTRDLAQGTLRSMGPAMLPRWLAVGVGLSGLALVAFSFVKVGEALERWSLRGPLFVILAIFAFAVTIRPFSFGTLSTPGLGLLVAGPLAIVIGGHASPEARIRDLAILALSLTPFCMLLFGDALGLAIPMFPQAMTGLFPDGWSQKAVLRTTAAILACTAILVFLLTRRRRELTTEVAGRSGQI